MQNTSHLVMIQPTNFGFNKQTAANNYFQNEIDGNHQQAALQEFNNFAKLLLDNNIDVTIIKDTNEAVTPDAIFPNNWFSVDAEHGLFLYPMFAPNRRLEGNEATIELLRSKFSIKKITDLRYFENTEKYLEGTGSMVLDRENKIAYACLSPRTNIDVLNEFCKISGYTSCTFSALDNNKNSIYHTNVMMCVADKYVVICLASIADDKEREKVITTIHNTDKEIIEIWQHQLNCFAGNMLQVKNKSGELFLIMSSAAYNSLTAEQITKLNSYNTILHSNINTIESIGGGSARCMLAEVFV
jgi:hypothetical protein